MALPPEITLTISPRTITLDKKAVLELCRLILRAAEGDEKAARIYFRISGGEAAILASTIENLAKPRWPSQITEVLLSVDSYNKSRSIRFHLAPSVNQMVISAVDSDWANQMAADAEAFFSRHRNNHWIYQTLPLAVIQASVLLLLLLEAINNFVRPNLDPDFARLASALLLLSSISLVLAYVWVVRRLFPLVIIDGGRSNNVTVIRKVLSWTIPVLIAALLVGYLWGYFA